MLKYFSIPFGVHKQFWRFFTMKKLSLFLAMLVIAVVMLTACGGSEETTETESEALTDYTVAMVTDIGGIDDKSFNQSAWEGIQAYGEENQLVEGEGYDYIQSGSDADYIPSLTNLAEAGFSMVVGVGFMMVDAVDEVAALYPDTDFVMIDGVVEQPNVASVLFAENEGAFLCGVVAGMTTKTDKVGFVGGMEGPVIEKFEAGFTAGVHTVNPDCEVMVKYAGDFNKPDVGQQIASTMYKDGCDIIFHAAGATGKGVFTEAKSIKQADPTQEVWVIGVDSDQWSEGVWDDGGTPDDPSDDQSVTLTSMMKRVDVAVKDLADKGKNGEFPAGETIVYNLASGGVGISEHTENLTPEVLEAVDTYTQKIVDGEIVVPSTMDEVAEYEATLQ